MADILADLCPVIMKKAELVNDETGHLTEEISKQSLEERNMQAERDKLREAPLTIRIGLDCFLNSHPYPDDKRL